MELRHLRYFHAVASNLSFSRAAQLLHIAQPPLSRQIRQLESMLGTELFDRDSRPIALTMAGKFFYEQTLQVMSRLAEIEEGARRIARGRQDWFSIGFVPSTLYGLLPELIRRFRQAAPGIEVGVSEFITMEQAGALKLGRIDVGFGRLQLNDPAIASVTLFNEPLLAALPMGHPLLAQASIGLADLAQAGLIVYPARPRPSYADQVLAILAERGLRPAVVKEANEMQTALGLVAAGIGVALVPASVQGLQRTDVAYRSLAEDGVVSPVIMHFRMGDTSPLLRQFRAMAAELLAGEAGVGAGAMRASGDSGA